MAGTAPADAELLDDADTETAAAADRLVHKSGFKYHVVLSATSLCVLHCGLLWATACSHYNACSCFTLGCSPSACHG